MVCCLMRLRSVRVVSPHFCRCEVADALVATVVVVVIDDGGDRGLEFAFKVIVLKQDAVLEALVPGFDLALGLLKR